MGKTDATRRKRRSKVVNSEVLEEEDSATPGQTESVPTSKEIVETEEDAPKEDQDEQDSQMETVIEVKRNTSTVTVSWDKQNEEGEADDSEKRTNASDQMMDSEEQIISSSGAVGSTEDAFRESTETNMMQDMQESGESRMDTAAENTAAVTVTLEKSEEGGSEDVKKEANGGEQKMVKKKAAKRKRKARSTVETSPPKKTKLISDVKKKQKEQPNAETSPSKKTKVINKGFCVFIGNLDKSKSRSQIEDSLAKYLMTNSVLFKHIRLDKTKKFAYADMASEMDMTKALTFNGEVLHDKPMKIARAKVISKDKAQPTAEERKEAKDGRCLFLKNIPYAATKNDIVRVFRKAIDVRFLGGTQGPERGIAFVEFQNKTIAKKMWLRKQGVQIHGRVLTVDRIRNKDNEDIKKDPPCKTLFVHNLPVNVKRKQLNTVFQEACNINVPKSEGKTRGFAFVEFRSVEDAEKALESSKNVKINKKLIGVQFSKTKEKSGTEKVLKKTLIVMGLAETTTAETLQRAFEGALRARVTVDRETGVSKRYGFVDFEHEDTCKSAMEAMEDCEIDGSKVTVTYSKIKTGIRPGRPHKPPRGPPADQVGVKTKKNAEEEF
ncbi:nucleolin-like isoform X3 [Plectropomus leopardus]|uniref:nucleolin-like isoform X3 n=1 Tax=Plectropomus leopardus TaxID=160734 RepID=UPI001C4A9B1B|nr:nucleolin-like isoform X3 [Plectropomus leopardus]